MQSFSSHSSHPASPPSYTPQSSAIGSQEVCNSGETSISKGHRFHPTILRTYDVRGIVGETLHPEDAYILGRCFGTILRKAGGTAVALGRDGRLSSQTLEDRMKQGLLECGLQVLTLGQVPTPVVYFSEHVLDVQGGIMITGSHNPMNHNGFKLSFMKKPFYGPDLKALEALALSGTFAQGVGTHDAVDLTEPYIQRLFKDFSQAYSAGRPLKVAWDPGNGVTGPLVTRLVQCLPGIHTVINAEVDGTFPHHHPDPQDPKNLQQLQSLVREGAYDLGIAFDGDGDRIGAVDETGSILWGDHLLLLYAEEVLETTPQAQIIADIKSSQLFLDHIQKKGGRPLLWRTGHSLIKQKMLEINGILAGEMSGHMFFRDRYYGFDDALYAALRLVGITSRRRGPLSLWRQGLPCFSSTPEIKISCDDQIKFSLIENLKNHVKKNQDRYLEILDMDGVRIKNADGWWLLRASNTTNALIARLEASDSQGLERLKKDLYPYLKILGFEKKVLEEQKNCNGEDLPH